MPDCGAGITVGMVDTALDLARALGWLALEGVPLVNLSLEGAENAIVAQALGALALRSVRA